METKISKAQLDVWEWKEKAFNEIKHLSIMEQLDYIHKKTAKTIELLNEKMQPKKER